MFDSESSPSSKLLLSRFVCVGHLRLLWSPLHFVALATPKTFVCRAEVILSYPAPVIHDQVTIQTVPSLEQKRPAKQFRSIFERRQ